MEQFNFNLSSDVSRQWIMIHSPLVVGLYTLPPLTILRVENITMGGRYKRPTVEISFSYLVSMNKHISLKGNPARFNLSVVKLNGLQYEQLGDKDAAQKILVQYLRDSKLNKILD